MILTKLLLLLLLLLLLINSLWEGDITHKNFCSAQLLAPTQDKVLQR
jgi:hypothetical protein